MASSRDIVDNNWTTVQATLAFFLPDKEWTLLAAHYALLPHLRAELESLPAKPSDEKEEFKNVIRQQLVEMAIWKDIMAEFGGRSRLNLFWAAILGRTTHAKATRQIY